MQLSFKADTNNFNRGMIINVGFTEAMKDFEWDCFIFHDVDLLPENDKNLYNCPEKPRHMSVAVDKFKYKLPYKSIFGGVVAISTKVFQELNGFSNLFWGWGGEDDDMAVRIKKQKLKVERYDRNIARYTMIRHKGEQVNKIRMYLLKSSSKRRNNDGLKDLEYKVVSLTKEKLYTNVTVRLHLPKNFAELEKEAELDAKREMEEKKRKKALQEAKKKQNLKNVTASQKLSMNLLGTTVAMLWNLTAIETKSGNKTKVVASSQSTSLSKTLTKRYDETKVIPSNIETSS